MKREDCICYSGAANGAEVAFGAAAERHGIDEVNFTFEGHVVARQRGRRDLTRAELRHGDVSLGYLSKLMHRSTPTRRSSAKSCRPSGTRSTTGRRSSSSARSTRTTPSPAAPASPPSTPSCSIGRCTCSISTRGLVPLEWQTGNRRANLASASRCSAALARASWRLTGAPPSKPCSRAASPDDHRGDAGFANGCRRG